MTQTIQMLIRKFRAADKKYVRNHSWGFFGIRVYVGSDISRFMPRARLCHAKREQLPKSQHIPITCASYRGAYIRHNPGSICYPKCGKQTPFIPSEVRKNLIGGLLLDLYSLSMAPDYAAQKRAKSQRYHRIAAVTQDNQGLGIHMQFFPTGSHTRSSKRVFGSKGSGCTFISSPYGPNRLRCPLRYGLRWLAASGVMHTPSCCRAASTLVISTTLCNMMAFATKSRYLMRFSCSTGSPVRSTGPPNAIQSVN